MKVLPLALLLFGTGRCPRGLLLVMVCAELALTYSCQLLVVAMNGSLSSPPAWCIIVTLQHFWQGNSNWPCRW